MMLGTARAATAGFGSATRFTTIKDPRKEIGPGLLRAMLRDLGLTMDDLG